MGAWGLSLFQSDLDYDLIGDLNLQLGLKDLEEADGKPRMPDISPAERRQKENAKVAEHSKKDMQGVKRFQSPKTPKQDPKEISYSVYAKLCSDLERVRTFLDDGALAKGMKYYIDWIAKAKKRHLHDPYGPGYYVCLLGACAMTLGAKITDEQRDAMRKRYDNASFMRGAVAQLEKAIEGYVNGVPWEFDSKGLQDTQLTGGVADEDDLLFPGTGMINVRAPDHGRGREEMDMWKVMVTAQITIKGMKPTPDQLAKCMESLSVNPYLEKDLSDEGEWLEAFCGNCGAEERENGEPLLECTKCKKQKYCSRQCQRKDLKDHKKRCKVEHPNHVCDACGAKTAKDGEPLLECSKCKVRKYCSRQCQKDDWKTHKTVCKVA
ncbi:hypothetical protein M409DRAFT_55829 [Zasmidium cellare ATCC 36951]|uniref:MYND-type domain-containing protein n=1 Tax=Zasmidium cellare ATCC 36951 TaxID=1080233 RepID=A0A6A6CFL1_ZASCE|nr:uncharacterized protein M409DRAFT_55829 [Zasmidium cellare ATCC 36951]KAF2165433.1 hypothetical protein M409DRAFT_55829 [Zasmidium cellare ATCC 36951]